jgi:hypothetical protein
MRLMCNTYEAAGVYWRISCAVYASLLGILQECGELGHMMPWVIKSQEKRNLVGFYAFRDAYSVWCG